MKIKFRLKKVKLDDNLKSWVVGKLNNLTKFMPDLPWVKVEFIKNNRHRKGQIYLAEIQTKINRKRLITKQQGADLYSAFDLALDKIAAQIRKIKRKTASAERREERRWKRVIKSWRPAGRFIKGLPGVPTRLWRRAKRR